MNIVQDEEKIAKELGIAPWRVCIVGSTLICGSGNDQDFLCLAHEDKAFECGFKPDVELSYESPLRSFRRGNQNLIVTSDKSFFFAEMAIANAAKLVAREHFDMSNRDQRIAFHSAIRANILARMDHESRDISEIF